MMNEEVVKKRKSWLFWVFATSIFWAIAFFLCTVVSAILLASNTKVQEVAQSKIKERMGVEGPVGEDVLKLESEVEELNLKINELEEEKKELMLREEIRKELEEDILNQTREERKEAALEEGGVADIVSKTKEFTEKYKNIITSLRTEYNDVIIEGKGSSGEIENFEKDLKSSDNFSVVQLSALEKNNDDEFEYKIVIRAKAD